MALVRVTTSDGNVFVVPRALLRHSGTIDTMLKDLGLAEGSPNVEIPLANVSAAAFEKIKEWMLHHADDPPFTALHDDTLESKRTDNISDWDARFMQMDHDDLFELMMAANYLDMKALVELVAKTIANMIKGKTTLEIRRQFNIVNDFTPEEEEAIRRENAWDEE